MKILSHYETDNLPPFWSYKYSDVHMFTKSGHGERPETFYLQTFPGDCGTLILRGVSNISREALRLVREIASTAGYDTVIATYVNVNNNVYNSVESFKKERWIKVVDGRSNRKFNYQYNRKIVYVLHIRDCKHKGY